MNAYKYHGAGNDFIILDNSDGTIDVTETLVRHLCHRHLGIGADGLMVFRRSTKYDFGMQYFNSDGSTGMMCGNGGRCIIAFAAQMGILPSSGSPTPLTATHQATTPPSLSDATLLANPKIPTLPSHHSSAEYIFEAPDGIHRGHILRYEDSQTAIVRLKMNDVSKITISKDGHCRMNTGCDHLVVFCPEASSTDVMVEGPRLRYSPEFAPSGVNVNFVEVRPSHIIVRTYEKGVEGETLSCGTGVIASAIATYLAHHPNNPNHPSHPSYPDHPDHTNLPNPTPTHFSYDIRTTMHNLKVEFTTSPTTPNTFTDIHIIGPATFTFVARVLL